MRTNKGFLELRRLEAARDIANLLATSGNRVMLDSQSLLLNGTCLARRQASLTLIPPCVQLLLTTRRRSSRWPRNDKIMYRTTSYFLVQLNLTTPRLGRTECLAQIWLPYMDR